MPTQTYNETPASLTGADIKAAMERLKKRPDPLQPEPLEAEVDIEIRHILEQAKSLLRNWLVIYVEKYCDPVPEWKPQPDLLGMIMQFDNASTVTGVFKARAEAAEKREDILWQALNDVSRITLNGLDAAQDTRHLDEGDT